MDFILKCLRELAATVADYEREISHLHQLLANRDDEVDALRAELVALKVPAAA